MDSRIYRVATKGDWQRAIESGAFASSDLQQEGFIHCSFASQILRTLEKYYAAEVDLLILDIARHRLGETLICENLTGSGVFPHVYAPIRLSSIERVVPIRRLPTQPRQPWTLPVELMVPSQ